MSNQQTSKQHTFENNTFQLESIIFKEGGTPRFIYPKYIHKPGNDDTTKTIYAFGIHIPVYSIHTTKIICVPYKKLYQNLFAKAHLNNA